MNRGLTAEQSQEVHEAFTLFDSDKKGSLEYYEFKVALRALGIEISAKEVKSLLG